MKKPRHDYNYRPEPLWENGHFVPPAPVPIAKPVNDWNRREWFDYVRAAVKNPVVVITQATIEGRDDLTRGLGTTVYTPMKADTMKEAFVEKAEFLRMSALRNNVLKPIIRNGLLASEGKRWRDDRRALAPVFTPRHVHGYADTMADATARILPGLLDQKQVAIDDIMVELTYIVLSEALFSGELDEGRRINLREIDRFLNSLGKPDVMDIIGAPQWIPRPSRIGHMGPVKRLRRHIFELVENRRTRETYGETIPDDLLKRLMTTGDFDDESLKDQLLTFIAAGHETTSRALCWLYYLLSQDTTARGKLEAEVDRLDISQPPHLWRERLEFTEACLKEAMRLYPPAPFLARETNAPVTLGGHDMNEGVMVFGNLWGLHRNRMAWDDPDAFVPERFLPGALRTIDRFQYLPFGVGPRVCIGAQFAILEALIMIVNISRRYRFHLSGDHPWPLARVTVRPETPLMMRVERR